MPKSSFCYHRATLESKDKYADLKQHISQIYHQHKGRYGYRRMTAAFDCYNNEIVSYTLSRRLTYELVHQMLDKALGKTKAYRDKTLILHFDQGWPYQLPQFRKMLKKHDIKQSMSRKGNCLDNALMEGFFGTLKCENIYIDKPQTIEDLEQKIHEYIHYYNHERIQLKLKGLSPVQYRTQSLI